MSSSITFTEVMDMGDDLMTITNTWMAVDECGNQAAAVQVLAAIVNSDLTCNIEAAEEIRCNTHANIVSAAVEGGDGPFTYEWSIEGTDCQIQGGQGTEEIEVYVGFNTAVISLQVIDANNCVSFSERILDCTTKGEPSLGIGNLTPNPTSQAFELLVKSSRDQTMNYQIVDVLGRVSLQNSTEVQRGDNMMTFDVEDYPGGTYFVKITDGESTVTRKFMKIK